VPELAEAEMVAAPAEMVTAVIAAATNKVNLDGFINVMDGSGFILVVAIQIIALVV